MGHEPCPLPGSTFTVVITTVIGRAGIERCTPITFTIQSAHESGGRVKIMFIPFGKLRIFLLIGRITQFIGQDGNTPVIISVFQSLGYRFIVLVTRHISYLILPVFSLRHQVGQHQRRTFYSGRIIFRSTETSFVCFFHIKVPVTFCIGVGNEGCRMIANHRAGIISSQFPHREYTAFTLFQDERADKRFV